MSEREWRFYIDDMIDFAEHVLAYSEGMDQASLVADRLHYDATIRNLELIGEAATHVPDAVREENKEIPWRLIIATRNRLIHGYLGIDQDTLWSIIQSDIPALLAKLRALRDTLQTDIESAHVNDHERHRLWSTENRRGNKSNRPA